MLWTLLLTVRSWRRPEVSAPARRITAGASPQSPATLPPPDPQGLVVLLFVANTLNLGAISDDGRSCGVILGERR